MMGVEALGENSDIGTSSGRLTILRRPGKASERGDAQGNRF